MKRIILSALTVTLALGTFNAQAQEDKAAAKAAAKLAKEQLKAFTNDLKEAKKLSEAPEKPDFAGARAALAKAKENENGKDNPEYYFAAGNVDFAQFNYERQKPASGGTMDEVTVLDATAAAYDNYVKAYDLYLKTDPKNKNIAQIQQNAYECYRATGAFRANAGRFYNEKNWQKARDFFNMSLDATQSAILNDYAETNPIVKAELEPFKADSMVSQTAFNRAVCSIYMENHELAKQDLEFMKDKNYETNLIYQSLAKEYLTLGDSAAFENLLKEGVQKMPTEPWYSTNLLNIYLDRKDYAAASTYIDDIIKTDPNNATYVDLKGRLLEMQEDNDGALACYKKATELDPTNAGAWSNLGRIYFNRANDKENELYDKKRYDDVDKVTTPLYNEALPFYENAFAFDTEHKDMSIPNAMRTILYKQFQKPSCPNKQELIAKYNEVSAAYGMPGLK